VLDCGPSYGIAACSFVGAKPKSLQALEKRAQPDCALAVAHWQLRIGSEHLMVFALGGTDLRNLLADYVRKLPIDLRTYLLPFIYGLFGGLFAVAFQKRANILFSIGWEKPSQQMSPGTFAFFSIPQTKVAFCRNFGFMPVKVVIAKLFAGAISIGGSCSLGREGPTVHVASALSSNIAGWLGVAKQGRRPALLSGAAAGLAAAFNTPLSAITFVLEEWCGHRLLPF
jgi:Voltage gated chloride channel